MGAAELRAEYVATAKNNQVARLFDDCGLQIVTADAERRAYRLPIADYNPRAVPYIRCRVIGEGE